MRVSLLTVMALLALAGCGANEDDLRQYLEDERSFDSTYAVIPDAEITVTDSEVNVRARQLTNEDDQAREICEWVSAWVYDEGNGEDDTAIYVRGLGGYPLAERQHANSACGT